MNAAAVRHRTATLLFVGIAAGVYAAALAVVGQLPHLERARVVAIGLMLDMVVVVPLAFYFLVVRRAGLPPASVAVVVVLSVAAASRVLPADQRQPLRVLEILAVPAELGLLGWIASRTARALRDARRDAMADPLEQLRRAAFELTRSGRAAAVFASEIGVFYYGFASWRARPHVPPGWSAFTHHVRSGHAGIVLAFLLVLAAEGLAVHALLFERNGAVAWLFTIGTAYGALWLVADYRATVLRPILVREDGVLIRAGFRCTLWVPRACIVGIGRAKPAFGRECLNLTFLGTPTRWLTLSESMEARGPYGFRRRVRAIGIEADAAEEFDRILGPESETRG